MKVQLEVALFTNESALDVLRIHLGVTTTSCSNVDDGWLDVAAELLESSLEDLFGVDDFEVGLCLQEWHELLPVLIVDSNSLRENGRGLVVWIVLVQSNHSLLANVFGALQREHSIWCNAILDEELGLELSLWEVFKQDSRGKLLGHLLDEGTRNRFVILSLKLVLSTEVIEVHQFHVGSLAESVAEGGLSRGFWSNNARDLWEHGLSSHLVCLELVTVGVDSLNFAKTLIKVQHWDGGLLVGGQTLGDSVLVVILAA